MRLPYAFFKRDYLVAVSYRTAFTMQILSILAFVPVYFFLGKLFGDTASGMLDNYGGSYFAFLLIGMAFLAYMNTSLRTFNMSLRESQLMGTLEIVLSSPTPLWKVLVYSSLWFYMLTTVQFGLYLLVGLLFGLELGDANLLGSIVVLFLGVISFASFGILTASVVIIIKQGNALNAMVSYVSLILGGVLYPVEVLPGWLQMIAKVLPITHALAGMRMALLNGASWSQLLPYIGILCLFGLVLLPTAILSFAYAVRLSKISGTLAQY